MTLDPQEQPSDGERRDQPLIHDFVLHGTPLEEQVTVEYIRNPEALLYEIDLARLALEETLGSRGKTVGIADGAEERLEQLSALAALGFEKGFGEAPFHGRSASFVNRDSYRDTTATYQGHKRGGRPLDRSQRK